MLIYTILLALTWKYVNTTWLKKKPMSTIFDIRLYKKIGFPDTGGFFC